MKRTISMFGALAVAAIGFLFAAPAAHATHNGTPTTPPVVLGCTLVNTAGVWPKNNHYYYCGLNSALYREPAGNAIATLPTHLRTLLLQKNVYLFVWDGIPPSIAPTPVEEMNLYFGISEPVEDRGGFSLEFPIQINPPFYAINGFERVKPLFKPMQQLDSATLNKALVHERCHALDYAYSYPSENPGSVFRQTLVTDWAAVNALPESTLFPHGIPPKRVTEVNGVATWVTYTPPKGPSTAQNKRNETILKALLPQVFGTDNEMFAFLCTQAASEITDVMNPYTDAVTLNGHTLSLIEALKHFPMTKLGQTPKRYFDKMGTPNSGFVP
jgi:hypothetical protein